MRWHQLLAVSVSVLISQQIAASPLPDSPLLTRGLFVGNADLQNTLDLGSGNSYIFDVYSFFLLQNATEISDPQMGDGSNLPTGAIPEGPPVLAAESVPEPLSVLLVGLGLGLMLPGARRRQKPRPGRAQ